MPEPTKRVLTDDLYNAHSAANHPPSASTTPDDLFLRLRNAGSRVRKSVTEGYKTTPSSFSKAQSTGSIFRSVNDTMREIYANPPEPTLCTIATRKRARSFSECETETIPEDSEISVDDTPSSSATRPAPDATTVPRIIKPLRAPSRAFLGTRSLPISVFGFTGPTSSSTIIQSTDTADEDDWSYENSFQTSQPAFEPMTFD